MKNIFNLSLQIPLLFFFPMCSVASDASSVGMSAVALNLMEPITLFGDFIQTACFIIGASFLFASLIKYFEHRRSPTMVPIGTVIFLLISGIILILLPFLSLLIEHGVPFSLMK